MKGEYLKMLKKVWYVIKNVVLAIGITAIGSYMAKDVNSAILWIVGIFIIFNALSTFGETNTWVSLVVIGIGAGAIALGKTVLKDNDISYYISAGFIALIALRQLLKLFDSYGKKKWQKVLMKLLTLAYPALLIGGAVFAVFFHNFVRATSFFSTGSALWIIHTIFVVCLDSVPSRSGSKKIHGSSGGASGSKVAQEMKSLANYFTGGFDSLGYGTNVYYNVSANISGDEITFTVSGRLSGGNSITDEAQVNSVKGALENAMERRQQLILNKATAKLESMNPDSDYTINVVVGNISA